MTELGAMLGIRALGPVGLALGLGYEAIRAPTQIGHLEQGYMAEAKPYTSLVRQLYRIGRASGTSGAALVRELFPGEDWTKSYQTPPWMSRLGVSPDDVTNILSRYGIVPRSAGEAKQFARSLRLGEISPAYSGMGSGTVERLAREAAGLGLGNRARPDYVLARIAPLMEFAVAKGMDRASILRSMEGSLARLSHGSFGVSLGGLKSFYQRLMGSGLPGGRTGQLQAEAISGVQGSIHNLNRSPLESMMMARAIAAHGNFSTDKDIAQAMPHAYAMLRKTAAGRKLLGDIEAAHGRPMIQTALLKSVFAGDVPEYLKLLGHGMPRSSFPPGPLGGAIWRLAMSNVTGLGVAGYYGLNFPGEAPRSSMSPNDAAFLGYMGAGHFTQSSAYYKRILGAQKGMSGSLEAGIIAAARAAGIDPLRLAALAKYESGFNVSAIHRNKNGSTDYGAFQLNSAWLAAHHFSKAEAMDPRKAAALAALHMQESMRHGQNPFFGYNPKRGLAEMQGVRDAYLQMTGGMPNDLYGAHAAAGEAAITGAMTSFEAFGRNLEKVNAGLSTMAGWLGAITRDQVKPGPMPMQGGPL